MNMMRKNNNRGGNRNNNNRGGGRRYNNNGGGNRGGQNEGQNLQRQKHHATQQREKYSNMARDAQNNGDRVDVEYYLQHVDHYTRVLTGIAEIEAERFAHLRESQIIPGGPNDPNAQQAQTEQSSGGEQSSVTNGGDSNTNNESSEGNGAGEFAPTNQPRMTRQPRRQQYDDNGAREANSNTSEIPLPGSILPPI